MTQSKDMTREDKSREQLIEEIERLHLHLAQLKEGVIEHSLLDLPEQPQIQYESLVNSVDGVLWEADGETLQFTFVGQYAERLLGYPVEYWLSEHTFWLRHIHPDDREKVIEFCRNFVTSRQGGEFEYRMFTADGALVWLRNIVRVVVTNEHVIKLHGLMIDITRHKHQQENLSVSLDAMERLIQQLPVGVQIFDINGLCVNVNQSYLQIFGVISPPEQIVGSFNLLTDPLAEAAGIRAAACEALAGQIVHLPEVFIDFSQADSRFFQTQGQSILSITFLPVRNVKDEITRLVVLSEDITERKQAEEELRSSEEHFRQVIASIVDHIYVTKVTEAGRLNLYLSPHVESLTGYPLEKFENNWRFWPSTVIHPEDRGTAAVQAAQLAKGQDSETEYRLVRADGKVIWVRDRAKVRQEDSSIIIYGLVSDITERKRAELEREWLTSELRDMNQTLDERVRARTAELQAILDAAGEGIIVTDPEGVIQYLNPALERLTGYSEVEALGKTPRLWSSRQHDTAFYREMWQTILSGQNWRGELVNKRKDGTAYHALLTINPIPGPNGQVLGFVGVQSDITPLKEMDQLKSEFISTAAHELRTPLTSIQGFSEILLNRELSEERSIRYLSFINQQAEALAAIIDDLLDLSRLESKEGFEINEMLVDLQDVVGQVVFGFQENHPRHHYRIVGPDTWPFIKGDPAKLAQLFKNLFSNATKYSPQGGEIVLQATIEPEYSLLHLTLTDHGVGMTKDQLAHIFDRFYRADASNTAIGGTGLGMTISRLIVERHKGKIWVESEYRVGTTVHVLLPLPDRPPYILVIEDDVALQEIQQRSLEFQGFEALTVGEGKAGLTMARACLPNLILLDLALPGMTGFTVLDNLKDSDLTQTIPVIITSAIDRPEEIEKAIAKGVIDYLVKPYTMSDLTVRVNRALAEAKREIAASSRIFNYRTK